MEETKKNEIDSLKDELFFKPVNSYAQLDSDELKKAYDFSDEYKSFLTECKTERLCVSYFERLARENGFLPFEADRKYRPGDRVFLNNRGKSMLLAVIGKAPVNEGLMLTAAHIDSPRLDLKPRPLYESEELALFKTHYYGGIKKYQWTAIPLSLFGRVVKKDGSTVDIAIGEKEGDTQFCVTDLLPHLGRDQMKRTLSEGVKGEELNILIGSRPLGDTDGDELVKLNVMKLLNDAYGITEKDFLSAELEAVPAFKPNDIGFDRSLIGAYGHDDRVCAYPAARAIIGLGTPEKTCVCILADKEEIGSDGNSGMQSDFFSYFVDELAHTFDTLPGRILTASKCLSADVNVGFDPTYPDVLEKNNASFLNKGVVITKYTGARGKSDTSDASAEFMGYVRRVLDENDVMWQTGELGKVDFGGGGTVAKYIANMNVDVVDLGVPVLSMHAPFEIVAKTDVYSAYRAFTCFDMNK